MQQQREAAEKARQEAEKRALAQQRERERIEREEREKRESEDKEREEREKKERLASRGGVRGVRGTRASTRGLRNGTTTTTTTTARGGECLIVMVNSFRSSFHRVEEAHDKHTRHSTAKGLETSPCISYLLYCPNLQSMYECTKSDVLAFLDMK